MGVGAGASVGGGWMRGRGNRMTLGRGMTRGFGRGGGNNRGFGTGRGLGAGGKARRGAGGAIVMGCGVGESGGDWRLTLINWSGCGGAGAKWMKAHKTKACRANVTAMAVHNARGERERRRWSAGY